MRGVGAEGREQVGGRALGGLEVDPVGCCRVCVTRCLRRAAAVCTRYHRPPSPRARRADRPPDRRARLLRDGADRHRQRGRERGASGSTRSRAGCRTRPTGTWSTQAGSSRPGGSSASYGSASTASPSSARGSRSRPGARASATRSPSAARRSAATAARASRRSGVDPLRPRDGRPVALPERFLEVYAPSANGRRAPSCATPAPADAVARESSSARATSIRPPT